MPEPGWYPDPGGAPAVRWWDGRVWTEHVRQSAAPPPSPPQPPAPSGGPPAQSPPGPVVQGEVGGKELYADAQVIRFAGTTLRLDAVDWVAYFVRRPKVRYTGGGVSIFKKQSSLGTDFYFQIGRHPYFKAEFIEVHFPSWRKKQSDPVWEALVTHARRYVEPRLVGDITEQIAAGRTVQVGPLTLGPDGVKSSQGGFGWADLTGADYGDDIIRLTGPSGPVLGVPQANWNVSLLPALIPAVKAAVGR